MRAKEFLEGKSPHKKGSKKYKKHMAAKHAAMGEGTEKCKEGEYYCRESKKCKPIPDGHTVDDSGYLVKETATAGATSAGNIASISSVVGAKRPIKKAGRYGAPKAPQKLMPDGTAKNALDVSNNIMGGKAIKR